MLDPALKEQLKGIFAVLEADYTLDIEVSADHENRNELLDLLNDVADSSNRITCRVKEAD